MPYKIGGGFKLEAYDPDNGQYTEEDKIKMREYDDFWFKQPLTQYYEPHIPTFGIHDWDYAFNYVNRFKAYLYTDDNPPEISEAKCYYLFNSIKNYSTFKWLKDRGFSLPEQNNLDSDKNKKYVEKLMKYILDNTDFKTLYFFDYSSADGTLLCNALTNIKGYNVTTGWKITSDFQLKFVTLIESTERYETKKNQIRRRRKINFW